MADATRRSDLSIGRMHSGVSALPLQAADHLRRVGKANRQFFEAEADAISQACWDMAKRFHRGGRLLVAASPACASDAYHVSVEFLHPVLVGKRALPAMVLEGDAARHLTLLARPDDIAFGILVDGDDPHVAAAFDAARDAGLLTVGLAGATGLTGGKALDHLFRVPDDDPLVAQEVQETCYHVLYELVHVFLDHEGLL